MFKAAQAESDYAWTELAFHYLHGIGTDPDYKKAIIKTKAPWEFINYGDAADCKKYVDDITAIGKEFKDLLTGKKG